MSNPRVRSGIRKKASLKLGRKTVCLNVGQNRELFTVHEELICVSPFFRNILQPRRKTIEGDCSICHEDLNVTVKELTYCATSCGGNFHRACIEDWSASAIQRLHVRCPLCRHTWVENTGATSETHRLSTLDANAFEVFFEWLYKTHVPYNKDDPLAIYKLIRAYGLGIATKNEMFCEDVLRAIFSICMEEDTFPVGDDIELAYNETTGSCRLRTFLVELYTHLSEVNFEHVSETCHEYPVPFWRDLTVALAANRGKKTVPWQQDALEPILFPQHPTNDSDD